MADLSNSAPRVRLDMLCRRLEQAPSDGDAAYDAADIASDHGWEEQAIPLVARAAKRIGDNPRLWHMLGVLHRGLEDSAEAMAAFDQAHALDPSDVLAAHGLARATFEAGLPAVARYEAALRLAPQDRILRQGHVAALAATGENTVALRVLAGHLQSDPHWIEGHVAFARIRAAFGEQYSATETLDAALRYHPRDAMLHQARIAVVARSATPQAYLHAVEDALRSVGDDRALVMQHAVATSETGAIDKADALFMAVGRHEDHGFALALLRHLVRAARWDQADRLSARLVNGPQRLTAWAYRHTVWRMTGDPRLAWLDQDGALVRSYDIGPDLPELASLAATLRGIHIAAGSPLDQSVRGGTQTEGTLFARIDPIVRAAREAIRGAVARHVASLPGLAPEHPSYAPNRAIRPRFAGSWSVRLLEGGHHVSHIHPSGWISSALYVALPDMPEACGQGRLTIGAPPAELGVPLDPLQALRPKLGRLTLFPSHTWHGVTPSLPGERLTIAFDVARPN
jgi:tetratricopeptide (TPR) repeat protein